MNTNTIDGVSVSTLLEEVGQAGGCWFDFCDGHELLAFQPIEVVCATHTDQVIDALRRVEAATRAGLFAAGYVAYEAATAFDDRLGIVGPPPGPLVYMALYPQANVLAANQLDILDRQAPQLELVRTSCELEPAQYHAQVQRLLQAIAAGEIYQANYTFREAYRLHGSPLALFRLLRRAHPVPYAAYLHTGPTEIVSLSPELFLQRRGSRLCTRPMKGTARRCPAWEDDEAARQALRASAKDRAENVMITDLMRNDLGRICQTGSVHTTHLCAAERFPSVHQLTSTVQGQLPDDCGLVDIFRATFPPGSVTGAPKIRATQLIADVEQSPRDVYCGAVGLVLPGGDFVFNVAIRTLRCQANDQQTRAVLGIGSGIVADSDPQQEWDECVCKSRFLQARPVEFALLETMLLYQHEFYWLPDHLRRLRRSARYFGIPFPLESIMASLRQAQHAVTAAPCKVRLLVHPDGRYELSTAPAGDAWPAAGVRVRLAPEPTRAGDPFLHHKTTHRPVYNAPGYAPTDNCQETVFCNDQGELTEGSRTSVFVYRDGRWLTPPCRSGLLPGVWRRHTLHALQGLEQSLSPDDLLHSQHMIIGNSVRGGTWVRELELPDGSVHSYSITPPSATAIAPGLLTSLY